MKKYFLIPGFAAYMIGDNMTAKTTDADGSVKIINVTEKGNLQLTCSEAFTPEGQNPLVVGKKYNYKYADLVAMANENNLWQDAPAEDEEAPKELTDAEKYKLQLKNLKAAESEASKAVIAAVVDGTKKPEEIQALSDKLREAQKALEEFKATTERPKTQELIDAEAKLALSKTELDWAKSVVAEASEAYKKAADAVRAAGGTVKGGGVTGGDHAPKLDYAIAQQIRKEFAVGRFNEDGTPVTDEAVKATSETAKAIAERHGISTSALNFIVMYEHYKLKKGDTAYTPLINTMFNAEKGFPNGAPFAGESKKPATATADAPAEGSEGSEKATA